MPVSGPFLSSFFARSRRVAIRVPSMLELLLVGAAALLCSPAMSARPTQPFPGTTSVGAATAPQSVTLTITNGGTAAAPIVSTQGVTGADFVISGGGTCAAGTVYTVGMQCTVNVVFQPKFPGSRKGVAVVQGADGSVLGYTLLAGSARGPLAVLQPGRIDTVAGTVAWLYRADGVAATSAPIFLPNGVVVDAGGNLYISDSANNRLRRVDATTGLISTVAGNGSPGFSGDNGPATQAMISAPAGLMLDGAGDIYFADGGNHAVRRVDALTGIITTVAGVGVQGYSGDAGPATAARLSLPQSVAFDATGNMYIADTGNNAVREVDAATGTIRTIAGTGAGGYNGDAKLATTAMLNSPWSVAFGVDGLLYIADLNNSRVRKIDSEGIISTVAGTGSRSFGGDGSAATAAELNAPAAIVFDPAGNLYIADSANNRVRKVNAITGIIDTIAGNGDEGFGGDTGPANLASLYGPYALFFDQSGNLLIADMFHNRVRRISATAISLVFDTIRVGKVSPPQAEGLENDGNADLTLTTAVFDNAALDPTTTTCVAGVFAADVDCVLGVEFAPTVVGDLVLGSVTQNSDAGNSPAVISVSGQVLTVEPTSVSLASSVNPSLLGAAVTFTATVASDDPARSGPVTFLDGAATLCKDVNLGPDGMAGCTVSTLTLGAHKITASYAGDANNAASVSPALTQIVMQTASLTLAVSPNPAVVTSSVTLTLTAGAATGPPTGAVNFYDGTIPIGSGSLNASGVATLTTTTLSAGTHSLSVKYAGDSTNAPGTSNVVSEVISQAATISMLSTSIATVAVGTAVTFTAAVSSTGGPAPTGTVQFEDGSIGIGSGTLSASGVATLTISTLASGAHSITAVYGGDASDAGSSSSALLETVQQLGTATLLTSDANPSNAGATVHLTATVSVAAGSTADGAITGSVTFTEGGTTLGGGTVNASGVITIAVDTLTVGSHSIVATYAGNTNYAGSASAVLSQVVQQTATTTTVSAGSPGSLSGTSVTLTATVTSASGIPSGTVSFLDNGVSLGQGTLNAQGVATISVSTLSVGSHSITSVYAGSFAYATSTSAPYSESVTLAATTLTLAGSANVNAGTTASYTVTLTSTGVAPTGSIVLHDGGTAVGAQPVSGVGTFTFTATLAIGTHTLNATYAADANNASSVSNNVTTVVQQATTAIALQSNKNPQIVGQSVTLTAAVTSSSPGITGSVTFQDGGVAIGSAVLAANGTASFTTSTLTTGTHPLTAVYSGDTDHAASTSTAVSEQIVQSAQIALGSSANPAASGATVVFTARVTAPATITPTGSVTFLDGATLLGSAAVDATGAASVSSSALSVGTHSVTANYAGDQNLSSVSSAPLVETIQNSSTQIALTASANPATYGTPLTFTVAVTTNGGAATGSVSFTDSGVSIGSALLGANGVATLTTSTLAPGAHSVVANYAGDGKASPSVSTPLAISVKQITAVALASNANPSPTLSPIVLTATVTNTGVTTPGGTVTFTDGSTQLGVGTLDASGRFSLTVPSLTAGSHSIQGSYSGDGSNFLSASAVLSQSVALRPTTTSLTATASNPNDPTEVTLIAIVQWTGTTAPTGTVTLTNGSITVGTVTLNASGVGTMNIFVQSGSEQIVATYNGDTAYATSSSAATAITGGPATQFTMSLAPPALTMVSKEHGVTTLTVASVKRFTDTLQFGCLGLPFAATCTFSSTQSKLAADGITTVQLTVDTGNPLGAGAQASNVHGGSSTTLMCFIPGALLTGLLLWRKRRKLPSLAAAVLLFCAMGAVLSSTGCAGLTTQGTPAGTYSFQVTAYGQGTGASQSKTMTLKVTQ
ncbi:MAG TPA: Ig-like domain repeat protein [Acidobacteriaceae bacterium]